MNALKQGASYRNQFQHCINITELCMTQMQGYNCVCMCVFSIVDFAQIKVFFKKNLLCTTFFRFQNGDLSSQALSESLLPMALWSEKYFG